jgi:putative transposase
MQCPHCHSGHAQLRPERTELGYPRFRCQGYQRALNAWTDTPFNRLPYPSAVVYFIVRWRLRYKLSLRKHAEMFLERGFTCPHETVQLWEAILAPLLPERPRTRRCCLDPSRRSRYAPCRTFPLTR